MFSTPFILSFSLLLFIPILFFLLGSSLNPQPSPPISASDEHDDLRLFHRATVSPSASSHLSSSSSPKIAFLFLTNTDLHFLPLWNRFFGHAKTSLFNVYVHADPIVNVTRPPLGTVFGDRFIPNAKRTFRSSATLISATRRLLATAILDDPANEYFAVVSQYCIPLHSFNYIYRSLFTSKNFDRTSKSDPDSSGFIQYGILKHKSYIEIISEEPRLWKRYAARGRFVMMPEVPFEEFRAGSQFFVLTRKDALLVLKDRTLWRKFKLPCFRADECYPEEHYFPTLLSMQDPNGVTGYTLTRVNWTGTVEGHPHMFKPKEVTPELIHELRKSNYSSSYLFARKFSPDCLRPLMHIADSLIFRD
ncbi:hypothetical protein F3Y22_tig00001644pilonHSYRG00624 [Hibiscus syriacus]|uniref:Uncharacterized protein n=1 Tax=Hibiscus syriacus TaxID=106335 RepID=A0A6A3D1D2_HIBSY|nr:glycosyltransferase BC10-like [Hibiscus syriacus]XP_039003065.1 glycosyltransferase BC10-like [Hibiscus syriacus]KAE8733089.1 hypothetical protein F3Y22_tig00001644pilonHSYRG00624 [Hibiscus syriacus]